MEKIAGFLEVWCADDTHGIVLSFPVLKPNADRPGCIVLSHRHARHLASVLIDHANYAEAEAVGKQPQKSAAILKERSNLK